MNQTSLIRTFVLISSVWAAACGSGSPAPSAAPAAAPAPTAASLAEVTGTAPRGAVISLSPAGAAVPLPEGPAVMDQYAKQFVPNVLYVRVGQPVEFRNSEDMGHNVTVNRRGTGAEIFNVGTEPQQKHVHTFDRAGQYDVLCDVHPGMQATVIAATSPMATVSDETGRFTIPNVAAGAYTLSATFEGRTVEQAVEVKGPRTEVKVQ
jgi:plastocyanin